MSDTPAPPSNPAPPIKKSIKEFLKDVKFKKQTATATAPTSTPAPTPPAAPAPRPFAVPAVPASAAPQAPLLSSHPSTPRSVPAAQKAPPAPHTAPAKVTVPTGYSAVARWGEHAIFAYHTAYLPPNPDGTVARGAVCEDGYWGLHEYTMYPQPFDHHSPFMGLLELPTPDSATWLEFFTLQRGDLDRSQL